MLTSEQLTQLVDAGATPEVIKIVAIIIECHVTDSVTKRDSHVTQDRCVMSRRQRDASRQRRRREKLRNTMANLHNSPMCHVTDSVTKRDSHVTSDFFEPHIENTCAPVEDKSFLLTSKKEKKVSKKGGLGENKNTGKRNAVTPTTEPEQLTPAEIALQKFIKHRRQLRKPMTDHALTLLKRKLNKAFLAGEDPVELLNTAIERGWLTVYPKSENSDETDYDTLTSKEIAKLSVEEKLRIAGLH